MQAPRERRCAHAHTRLGIVVARNGTRHVELHCDDCGENANGAGKWVARSRVPLPLAELPVLRDLRTAEDRGEQPTLFGSPS